MIMTEKRIVANNGSSIVLYTTEDGNTQLEVKLEKDTVWLTQSQMAELFEKDQSVIARHIKNAFNEGEVNEKSNMQILHNTQYKYRPTKMVHGEERNPLFRRRQKAYSRQHPRCPDIDDCREPYGRERCHGESCGQSNQQG